MSLIFGSNGVGKTCKNDADCYTSCDLSQGSTGKCVIPYGHSSPYVSACLMDRMSSDLKNVLFGMLGIFDQSNKTLLQNVIEKKVTSPQCIGRNSWVTFTGIFVAWHFISRRRMACG
jgi:hypothetical protein